MRLVDPFVDDPLSSAPRALPRKALHWTLKDLRLIVATAVVASVTVLLATRQGLAGEDALFFAGGPLIVFYLVVRIQLAIVPPLSADEQRQLAVRWSRADLRWAFRYMVVSALAAYVTLAFSGSGLLAIFQGVTPVVRPSITVAFASLVVAFVCLIFGVACVALQSGRRTLGDWLIDMRYQAVKLIGLESGWLRDQFNQGLRSQ